ncbi:GvpL/GvpF family gas vesicle protein [Streptomyces sp. NPDC052236]|uniref:GvpL/GvpF family gas vesicle protein n=1 Tax=Streptomyces sp. NPDC052236 TaxID=3365686 RepID=UPI0037CCF314
MTEPCVTWLYAVAFGDGRDPLAGIGMTGVAGEEVRAVEETGLVGIVGSVPVKDFRDPGRLEGAVEAHDLVIRTLARTRNVVPLHFATACEDDDHVRSLLAKRRTEFVSALDRVAGRTEWGVKAYVGTSAEGAADHHHDRRDDQDDQSYVGEGPGTACLVRHRVHQERQAHGQLQSQEAALTEEAEEIDAALQEFAVESVPSHPRPAGTMILDTAYLVPDIRAQEFAATVEALGRRFPDVRIELLGPWPAYTFTGGDITGITPEGGGAPSVLAPGELENEPEHPGRQNAETDQRQP